MKGVEFIEDFSQIGGGYGGYNQFVGLSPIDLDHTAVPLEPTKETFGWRTCR